MVIIHETGIKYNTMIFFRDECQQQIKGFSGARYKKFSTEAEAEAFVKGEKCESNHELSESKPDGHSTSSFPTFKTFPLGRVKSNFDECL